jgi:hypothetical protein
MVALCSGEGWDFYGRFNSGLSGFFSLSVDSWAFLDELVCSPLLGGGDSIFRTFCSSTLWQIYETLYFLFRMQKCRFTTPSHGAECRSLTSQNAEIIVLSTGGWDTHSSA